MNSERQRSLEFTRAPKSTRAISETAPSVICTSTMQFADQTFEESVEKSGLIVVGTVVDVGIKVFPEDIMDVDEDGNEYVLEHNGIPRAEVTVQIQEVLKDDVGLTSETVTFYDDVNDAIGESDSQKARYISQYAIDYQKGDRGLFLIDNDRGLSMLGYSSYYDTGGKRDHNHGIGQASREGVA